MPRRLLSILVFALLLLLPSLDAEAAKKNDKKDARAAAGAGEEKDDELFSAFVQLTLVY